MPDSATLAPPRSLRPRKVHDLPSPLPTSVSNHIQGSTGGARLASVRAVIGVHKGAREPSGVFARHQGDASAPGASSPLCTPACPSHIPVAGRSARRPRVSYQLRREQRVFLFGPSAPKFVTSQ